MYVSQQFEERDPSVLHALIRSHPLGVWVTQGKEGLVVDHIPFLLDSTRGERGTLVGHVARANPVWKALTLETACVVIFQGSQAYITPSWYPTKQEHGKVVPTWNYAVVHAHGVPRVIEDTEWLLDHVTALSDLHESAQPDPWSVSDAPSDYIGSLLQAIVGIEIPIDTLAGKWKTSQNRSLPDKLGVVSGLQGRRSDTADAMAALIQQHASPKDK